MLSGDCLSVLFRLFLGVRASRILVKTFWKPIAFEVVRIVARIVDRIDVRVIVWTARIVYRIDGRIVVRTCWSVALEGLLFGLLFGLSVRLLFGLLVGLLFGLLFGL